MNTYRLNGVDYLEQPETSFLNCTGCVFSNNACAIPMGIDAIDRSTRTSMKQNCSENGKIYLKVEQEELYQAPHPEDEFVEVDDPEDFVEVHEKVDIETRHDSFTMRQIMVAMDVLGVIIGYSDVLQALRNAKDPEYAEYLRLKSKFE